ncbi:MAG TPA: dihydrofolate reductase family protein [Candidatus Saccharimonadales bacterium]|nr:dihydrofolate reductase family protein [Candidatus Saccharimonadales bacterium]
MKVILADVISLNGKITKGDDPDIHSWSSAEDWEKFVQLRDSCDVIVIDRHTYETVLPKPEAGKLRIVLTTRATDFLDAIVPDQLEFRNTSVKLLIDELSLSGHKKVLVAGGGKVCADFMSAGLVDEFCLTLEPVLFGEGKAMLAERPFNVSLQLISVEKLNEQGTLLVRYKPIKSN